MNDRPPSEELVAQATREHLQARDAQIEPTAFATLWTQAEQAAQNKEEATASPNGWSAWVKSLPIAAAIAVVALVGLVGSPKQETDLRELVEGGDGLFTELTSTSAWRAPSDRLTAKYLRLPQWSSPKFVLPNLPDAKTVGENS